MHGDVYVDTSFFIATQIQNHPFHSEAVNVLETHKNSSFYFSLLTIDEIVFTMINHRITPAEISTIITEKIIAIKNAKLITYQNKMKQVEEPTLAEVIKNFKEGKAKLEDVESVIQTMLETYQTLLENKYHSEIGISIKSYDWVNIQDLPSALWL